MIHTADWHLCDRLGRLNRTDDLKRQVERVAAYCVEHQADVLVIAGDLFSEQASIDEMTDALQHLQQSFKPFFSQGGLILAITGNHDRDARINIVRAGMQLAVPSASGTQLSPGRMYLLNGTGVPIIQSRAGQRVQFVCVPYPFASRYNVDASVYKSREEEHRFLRGEVSEWIAGKAVKLLDPTLPTVLVAHLHVCGSEVHTLYKLTDRDDIQFQFADLQPHWAYGALGHIHKPQTLGGSQHIRYPGSLDQLDFGDTHNDYGVMLVDILPTGQLARLERLKLDPTPFATITLTDPAEVDQLPTKYPRHAETIARIRIPVGVCEEPEELARRLKKLFPRYYTVEWLHPERPESEKPRPPFTVNSRNSLESVVREYLTSKLQGDPDGPALLNLAETFLAAKDRA